ncbi:MAG: CNNM domain-containing protein [Planctomycetota bacterium]
MDPLVLLNCLIALCLVFLNGFFALTEFSLVRARETRLELLKEKYGRRGALALDMHRRMDRFLAATQLGVTVSSLGLGWVGEPAFAALLTPLFRPLGHISDALLHTLAFATAFAVLTGIHIILGEQVPKYIAITKAEMALLASARTMHWVYRILYVPLMVLSGISNWIVRMLGLPAVTEAETIFSKEELRLVLSNSHQGGTMSLTKVLLCENVLDFGDYTTHSIMTPLERVVMLDLGKPWAENLKLIQARRFSRYPVCEGDPARITGFIHFKEVMLAHLQAGGEVDLARSRRDLPKVDVDMPIEKLLPAIQRFPTNMAQVVDKEGRTVGIVTFEDVLEELVGEIADEFEREGVWRLSDHLTRERIIPVLQARDRDGVVRELAGVIATQIPGLDAAAVVQGVLKREKEMSTAVGEGLALPHARLENLPQTLIAYGRLTEGIDWKAFDNKPVRHIFMILTSQDKPREQLRALARISAIAQSEVLFCKLDEAATPADLCDIFRAADAFTPLDAR